MMIMMLLEDDDDDDDDSSGKSAWRNGVEEVGFLYVMYVGK